MAQFRLLNEFGVSSVVLALEPATRCACHCTYCFAELNKRVQYAGKERRDEDPGSFERTVERAFGPNYDPTDFRQWSLRNRLPVGWANTVEPFQDLPQAEGLLRIIARQDIPLFVQTKGYHFDQIWPTFRTVADNTVLFVSLPSLDPRIAKRFEPGTPPPADRLRMIETAAAAGMEVVLALAPYHEDWCADPGLLVRTALDAGAKHVFLDRLHLNERQEQTATDPVMVKLATRLPDEKYLEHVLDIHEAAAEGGASFYYNGRVGHALGFPSTAATFYPDGFPRRGTRWDYHRDQVFHDLERLTLADEEMAVGPIAVTFPEALAAMERDSRVDQPFAWSSLRELLVVKTLHPDWQRLLEPMAPISAYLRAIWNNPSGGNPFWKHPDARVAVRPDKQPWRDNDGNVVMVFDPSFDAPGRSRVVEDLPGLAQYVVRPPDPEE